MIEPSVGRKLWYWPNSKGNDKWMGTKNGINPVPQPFDATVVYVHNAREVNLRVSDHIGECFRREHVTLLQDDDLQPEGAYATWMPYQKGQAVKAEKAEEDARQLRIARETVSHPVSTPGLGGMRLQTLEETDQAAKAVQSAPRVSLDDIKAAIKDVNYAAGDTATGNYASTSLCVLTLCLIEMKNGFVVVGKSAPASPENFDAELGQKLAYEDAIRQIWPLMGFALREELYREKRQLDERPF